MACSSEVVSLLPHFTFVPILLFMLDVQKHILVGEYVQVSTFPAFEHFFLLQGVFVLFVLKTSPFCIPNGFGKYIISSVKIHDAILEMKFPFVFTSMDLKIGKKSWSLTLHQKQAVMHKVNYIVNYISKKNITIKHTLLNYYKYTENQFCI